MKNNVLNGCEKSCNLRHQIRSEISEAVSNTDRMKMLTDVGSELYHTFAVVQTEEIVVDLFSCGLINMVRNMLFHFLSKRQNENNIPAAQ